MAEYYNNNPQGNKNDLIADCLMALMLYVFSVRVKDAYSGPLRSLKLRNQGDWERFVINVK